MGVGVEVDLKGQCSCRLTVEVRQFAKKLFRFFVIFVTEGGIFGSHSDTEGRVGVEVDLKKSFRGCLKSTRRLVKVKRAQIDFFKN